MSRPHLALAILVAILSVFELHDGLVWLGLTTVGGAIWILMAGWPVPSGKQRL